MNFEMSAKGSALPVGKKLFGNGGFTESENSAIDREKVQQLFPRSRA
jgi:hypothetical protein